METINLSNKIQAHPNTNGGRAIKTAYEMLQNKDTLFLGCTIFRGLGLNVGILNHKSVVLQNKTVLNGGLESPLLIAKIL